MSMAVSRVPSPTPQECNTPVAESWCYTQVSIFFSLSPSFARVLVRVSTVLSHLILRPHEEAVGVKKIVTPTDVDLFITRLGWVRGACANNRVITTWDLPFYISALKNCSSSMYNFIKLGHETLAPWLFARHVRFPPTFRRCVNKQGRNRFLHINVALCPGNEYIGDKYVCMHYTFGVSLYTYNHDYELE